MKWKGESVLRTRAIPLYNRFPNRANRIDYPTALGLEFGKGVRIDWVLDFYLSVSPAETIRSEKAFLGEFGDPFSGSLWGCLSGSAHFSWGWYFMMNDGDLNGNIPACVHVESLVFKVGREIPNVGIIFTQSPVWCGGWRVRLPVSSRVSAGALGRRGIGSGVEYVTLE